MHGAGSLIIASIFLNTFIQWADLQPAEFSALAFEACRVAMSLANAFVSGAVSAVSAAPSTAPSVRSARSSRAASAPHGVATVSTGAVAGAFLAAGRRRQRNKVQRKVTVVSEAGTQAGERPKEGKPLKVIVAGGGVGGLTCAFAMLKKGWDVRVFETQRNLMRNGSLADHQEVHFLSFFIFFFF